MIDLNRLHKHYLDPSFRHAGSGKTYAVCSEVVGYSYYVSKIFVIVKDQRMYNNFLNILFEFSKDYDINITINQYRVTINNCIVEIITLANDNYYRGGIDFIELIDLGEMTSLDYTHSEVSKAIDFLLHKKVNESLRSIIPCINESFGIDIELETWDNQPYFTLDGGKSFKI